MGKKKEKESGPPACLCAFTHPGVARVALLSSVSFLSFPPFPFSLATESVIYFSERGRTHGSLLPRTHTNTKARGTRRWTVRTQPRFKCRADGRSKCSEAHAPSSRGRYWIRAREKQPVNLCNLAADEINNSADITPCGRKRCSLSPSKIPPVSPVISKLQQKEVQKRKYYRPVANIPATFLTFLQAYIRPVYRASSMKIKLGRIFFQEFFPGVVFWLEFFLTFLVISVWLGGYYVGRFNGGRTRNACLNAILYPTDESQRSTVRIF